MQLINHEEVYEVINDSYVVNIAKNDAVSVSHLPKFDADTLATLYVKAEATEREDDANLYVSYKKAYLTYANSL